MDSSSFLGTPVYRMFFKFHLIVDVEESIVNALYGLRITDQLFKSYLRFYTSGAFTIDSSTPTTR
jgi:hypothetical protein